MRRQAPRNSAVSVSAQRPVGSASWGGSAAKRQTKRSSGGIGGPAYSLDLDQQGHRPVVDQLDLHQRAEHAAARAQAIAHALVERLGVLRARGGDVGGPVALARVAVEREL